MKTLAIQSKLLLVASALLFATVNQAGASGLLIANDSGTELQLRDHSVAVTIEDGYAITTVENTFFNPSAVDVEAVYEFPVPAQSSVAEFTVWINGTPVTGEVVEKERARELYAQEKAAGRDAGLTEKKSFYRFESRVSPVRANQLTKTRLVYLQATQVEGGIGRYVYPLENGETDRDKQQFWRTDSDIHGAFRFDLALRSGVPVDAMRAPAHPRALISNTAENHWTMTISDNDQRSVSAPNPTAAQAFDDDGPDVVEFTPPPQMQGLDRNSAALNKDLVVYWRLKPNLPGSIDLVAHRELGERRGTFMLTVTPGIDLQPITEGRDWVFVLDRSGSMRGKYRTLMDATAQTLKTLGQQDRFKVVLFSNQVEVLTPDWVSADEISISDVSQALRRSQPGGGTDMYSGIKAAIDGLSSERTSSIILITDGVANLGRTEKADFLALMSKVDVRLFTGVMGNGANRPLLNSMTKVSRGFTTSVSNSDDIVGVLISATEKVKYQALHDVNLKIKDAKTSNVFPEQATTVYRGEQVIMFGHYFGDNEAEVILQAKVSGEHKEYRTRFKFPAQATDNPEIERLWAYAKIESLKDKADYLGIGRESYQSEIVKTAKKYGLVTDFTSMIVMNDAQFEAQGIERVNHERRRKEVAAAANRKAKPASSNRVDQSQPAFNGNRPNYSGGGSGAINPLSFLLLLPILLTWLRNRTR